MKGKVPKILLTVFLYLLFVLLWGGILLVLGLLRFFDTFLDHFGGGVLLQVFAFISVIGLIIPILFRKKMKQKWMMPMFLIIATIFTTGVNYGILYASYDYMGDYTREKWDKHRLVRYRMLDSLQEQYEFVGMTEQEVKEVLGEPSFDKEYSGNTKYNGHRVFQYIIGDDRIDPYSYDFIFEHGVVIDTAYSQH